MLSIITLKVGQLQTNCYLVFSAETRKVLIIDPGDDAEYIKNQINQNNLKAKMIITTHGHFDHILAGFDLQTSYNIPFLINKNDEFLVKNMQKSAHYYLKIKSDPPPKIDNYLKDKDKLLFEKSEIQIISTPGHTPGSICLYFPKEKWLFTGDTYFTKEVFGRTDFSYSSSVELQESLAKIKRLLPISKVFPGH